MEGSWGWGGGGGGGCTVGPLSSLTITEENLRQVVLLEQEPFIPENSASQAGGADRHASDSSGKES